MWFSSQLSLCSTMGTISKSQRIRAIKFQVSHSIVSAGQLQFCLSLWLSTRYLIHSEIQAEGAVPIWAMVITQQFLMFLLMSHTSHFYTQFIYWTKKVQYVQYVLTMESLYRSPEKGMHILLKRKAANNGTMVQPFACGSRETNTTISPWYSWMTSEPSCMSHLMMVVLDIPNLHLWLPVSTGVRECLSVCLPMKMRVNGMRILYH